jgi:hypothetical protein
VPPNYVIRTVIALILLVMPGLLSRCGLGNKRIWSNYALISAGFFLTLALAGGLARLTRLAAGDPLLRAFEQFSGASFGFAVLAFVGGAFAEIAARKTARP